METKKPLKRGKPLQQKSLLKRKSALNPGLKKPKKKLSASSKNTVSRSKTSVAKLKKEADKYWSIYIRLRDKGVCITCPTELGNQCGHFMSRRFNATRYDPQNTNGQGSACNVFRHGEQYKYALALDKKYGPGTAEKLAHKAQQPHKFTTQELQNIITYAKEQISVLS